MKLAILLLAATVCNAQNQVPVVVQTNFQSSTANWFSYNSPSDTGGVDTPAAFAQTTGNASPSLSGASMKFSSTTNATSTQTNMLFVNKNNNGGAGCNQCNYIVNDFWSYVDSTVSTANNYEFDDQNFNPIPTPASTTGVFFTFGHQCNMSSGFLQIANQPGGWTTTTVPCATAGFTANTWHHIVDRDHFLFGDQSCSFFPRLVFDSITIDSTTYALTGYSICATALTSGFTSLIGNQFQIDIGPTTGTPKTVNWYVDQGTFTAGQQGQYWSAVLNGARAVDWSAAGSPAVAASASWTQCGSTIAAGASAATINAALAACTANHYVQLGAGAFNLSTGLTFGQNNNIKLVGMGADKTFLIFAAANACLGFEAGVCMASADLNYSLSQSNTANWTAGYAAGTTSITLSSVTNLKIGTPLVLDQLDDTTDTGNIFVCYVSNGTQNCSTNGDNGGFARAGRGQQQIVTVTGISGTTVTITPGIYMPNWASGKSPQAWWATTPVFNMGVENLSMDITAAEPTVGTGFAVEMFNCSGCWVKGVRSIGAGRSHVQAQVGASETVQDSYFFRTAGQTSTSYGVESAGADAMLIQNNIFQQITEPMSLNGSCSGCVEGYNFDIDDVYDSGGGVYNWRMASSLPHAVGIDHTLVEGNQGSGFEGDIIHGSHHFLTVFRNAYSGYQQNNGQNPTANTNAMIMLALNRFFNIIGNALGSSTLPSTAYDSGTLTSVYVIGAGESSTWTVPPDSNVGRTLMRWGNYDVVTGVPRWCGNSSDPGWGTTCGSTTEVPSTISQYPNFIPATTTLPPSFYLAAKPPWWPSAKAWPAIGPDVTGGNLSGFAGYANTIPAADCYKNAMGGPTNGTGSVLTFNAATCYAQSQTGTQMLGPTRLTGTTRVQ